MSKSGTKFETFILKISAIGGIFGDVISQLSCLSAAVKLHEFLLNGVIHAPMVFFDTKPVGRILSRFSVDVEVIDDDLPWYLWDGIYCTLEV